MKRFAKVLALLLAILLTASGCAVFQGGVRADGSAYRDARPDARAHRKALHARADHHPAHACG